MNAGLLTQNLHGNDVTRLEVAGDIRNRNDYTFVTLPPGVLPPDLELQNLAEPALPISLFYDSATRQIGLRGRMSEDALAALLALQIRVIDGVGNPTFNPDGTLITVAAQLIPAAVAQELFEKSGDVPQRPPVGYQVGGGGKFEVRARNLDLGVTAGILSVGSAANAALGSLGSKGADLSIRVEKDLVLFSSAIISKAGGALQVEAGHEIQAGSSLVLPVSDGARGIYSSAGSDVMVQAGGNILLNGSRIAAYDGGKVTVRSTGGNIDAGSGGLSLQAVEQVRVNPTTGETSIKTDFIPGSGILATTFASGSAEVGDILVEAPRGDILARAGGVVQAPLNGTGNRSGKVQLTAGTKPSDGEAGFIGRIDASKSGVIGGNVSLDATGPIIGVVFASGNINIATPQAVNVTALAQGGVSVAAGGSISGTLVGVGSVTATGSSVDAALVSQNVSGSPGATAAVTASVATAASQSASAQATQSTPASKPITDDADEEARRLASRKPVLVRTVGRVKVLLPDATRSN